MGSAFKLIVVIFVCVFETNRAQTEPVVLTDLGSIRGSVMNTEKGVDFYAFRGIKYAEAPVGDKRFKAPVAVTKWDDEFDATKDGFMCPQKRTLNIKEDLLSEDCLVLNVYTRNLVGNKTVLIYIHGGANTYGGSHSVYAAGPEYFMESDIVMVSMNYRLGSLGFLSTQTKHAPGNYGYLDQLMAIQWVHDHISKFGGNPASVTLIGLSAGAMAVTLHMTSPLSQGLFHRAIALSGSTTSDYIIDNVFWTQQLAHEASCPRFNPEDVLSCLRKVPWQKIINITESWQMYGFIDMKFNYEVDGHFLKTTPSKSFETGNFTRVPIITGITKDEFTFMVYKYENDTGLFNDIYLNLDKYASEFFLHNFEEDPKVKKIDKVKSFYLGNKPIHGQNLENFGHVFADSLINHGVHRLVELARKYVDVYFYRFDYKGSRGKLLGWDGKPKGVFHGDDLQYVLKRGNTTLSPSSPEWFMVERMVGIFTAFAQNGSLHNVEGVNWLPSNKKEVHTLYIDRDLKLGSEPYAERFQLWDNLFPLSQSDSAAVCVTKLLIISTVVLSIFVKNWVL